MSEYRIKKGGREFTATRVDTLHELASRGLLRPGDPVSVDGGAYQPASDIPELAVILAGVTPKSSPGEEPWRHWGGGNLDGSPDASGDDSILSSFLDQIDSRRARRKPAPLGSTTGRQAKITPARPLHVVRAEPEAAPRPKATQPSEFPGSLSAVLSTPSHRSVEAGLPIVEPEALDPEEIADTLPADSISELAPVAAATPQEPPAPNADGPPGPKLQEDLPVSFNDWMERRGTTGKKETLLEGFGRYDDGIVVRKNDLDRGVNLVRVLAVTLVAAIVVLFYYLYVKTIAETRYPTEAELAEQIAGGGGARKPASGSDVLESVDATGPPSTALDQLSARERAMRQRVTVLRQKLRGNLIEFATAEQLEDALFQDLANKGGFTTFPKVEPLRHKDSPDRYNRRPTQAHLTVRITRVDGGNAEEQYRSLEDRLITTWLMVGKYGTLGRVSFEDVTITLPEPTPFEKTYQGSRLEAFWEKQIHAADLFAIE